MISKFWFWHHFLAHQLYHAVIKYSSSCATMLLVWHFLQRARMRKKVQAREENGYLYLLPPELRSQIPGGFLTQCSANECSWRSGCRVICSVTEGDKLHLSAKRILVQKTVPEAVFSFFVSFLFIFLLTPAECVFTGSAC